MGLAVVVPAEDGLVGLVGLVTVTGAIVVAGGRGVLSVSIQVMNYYLKNCLFELTQDLPPLNGQFALAGQSQTLSCWFQCNPV